MGRGYQLRQGLRSLDTTSLSDPYLPDEWLVSLLSWVGEVHFLRTTGPPLPAQTWNTLRG